MSDSDLLDLIATVRASGNEISVNWGPEMIEVSFTIKTQKPAALPPLIA